MPRKYLDELIERYPKLKCCKHDIWNAYESLRDMYQNNGKLLIAGNGGSAADAEHMVGELMKGFVLPRALSQDDQQSLEKANLQMGRELGQKLQGALPAIALGGHVALSTAFLNDIDATYGFAQQVYGYGQNGDIFLGITTSGNSANVLYACVTAKAKGMKTIALTGKDGGKIKNMADVVIVVPEEETFKIQELHLPIYHCLCLMLEEKFF